MNYIIPRLATFIFCLLAFIVGLYLQRQERKRRRERKQQLTNLISSAVGQWSATQAMQTPGQSPTSGLSRVQEQMQQQPTGFTH